MKRNKYKLSYIKNVSIGQVSVTIICYWKYFIFGIKNKWKTRIEKLKHKNETKSIC